MPEPVVIIAVIGNYDELLRELAAHRNRLGLSQLALDDIAGFQSGYTGKLEIGPRSKCGRGLGRMSLPTLLDSLGLKIALIASDNAAAVKSRAQRDAQIRANSRHPVLRNTRGRYARTIAHAA